jgi:hypothetical protein
MRDSWMRIMPGVENAAKMFQRGQAPLKRGSAMPEALNRLEMLPATSMRPAQGGHAVGDVLETNDEPAANDVEIVALLATCFEERLVGHENRGCEIVGQRDAGQALRLVGGEQRIVGQSIEHRPLG